MISVMVESLSFWRLKRDSLNFKTLSSIYKNCWVKQDSIVLHDYIVVKYGFLAATQLIFSISQPDFSPRLWDKIWEGPGDKARNLAVRENGECKCSKPIGHIVYLSVIPEHSAWLSHSQVLLSTWEPGNELLLLQAVMLLASSPYTGAWEWGYNIADN